MLTEAVFLSVSAGVLGIALTAWILKALPDLLPKSLPRIAEISMDANVLLFALAASIATGLLFGVLPAWRLSRLDPSAALRDNNRSTTSGRGQQRLQGWLVIAETALGLVLLAGSGLLIRSFVRVLNINPGFDAKNVLTANMNAPEERYPRERRIQFYQELMPRLEALPGVQSASAGFPLPLSTGNITISFTIEGRPVPSGDEPSEPLGVVLPGYFHTMRIPILRGREFTWGDNAKSKPVIIINEKFARKYFPGEDPIGKRIKSDLGDGVVKSPVREVIAVVGDVKRQLLTAEADPQYYLPWPQAEITSPPLCIRTSGDPTALIPALRAQIASIDRDIPLYSVRTMENSFSVAAAQPRFQTMLLSAFAAMALLLSAVGLYAVLSYMVAQRMPELGVRMALGAQRRDVMALIWRRGLMLALAGIVIGLAATAVLSTYIAGLLYHVAPLDPLTLGIVSAMLLAVSLVASSAPALRAARVDPMRTLRAE
jgi:predicted permease